MKRENDEQGEQNTIRRLLSAFFERRAQLHDLPSGRLQNTVKLSRTDRISYIIAHIVMKNFRFLGPRLRAAMNPLVFFLLSSKKGGPSYPGFYPYGTPLGFSKYFSIQFDLFPIQWLAPLIPQLVIQHNFFLSKKQLTNTSQKSRKVIVHYSRYFSQKNPASQMLFRKKRHIQILTEK